MNLLHERFVFWGGDWGFLKEEGKAYLLAPTLSIHLPIIFSIFTSIVYFKYQEKSDVKADAQEEISWEGEDSTHHG
jgi:hypothetical protein